MKDGGTRSGHPDNEYRLFDGLILNPRASGHFLFNLVPAKEDTFKQSFYGEAAKGVRATIFINGFHQSVKALFSTGDAA